MEFYNKQLKALRQVSAAEEMIKTGDFVNAKKKLFESLDFFPMKIVLPKLTICDILQDSSYHIPGCADIDYYKILLLEPSSTPQEVTFRYNKLLAMLQPLKHLFPGTKLALKYINEAFMALSGSEMRGTFDSQMNTDFPECSYKGIDLILSDEMNLIHVTDSPECSKKGVDLILSAEMKSIRVKDSPECSKKGIDLNLSAEMDSIHVTDHDPSPSSSSSRHIYQEFYNFDEGRNIGNVKVGEIWATRDHHRHVQIMRKSGSLISVVRLKPVPVNDREKRWCDASLPVGCCSFSLDLDSGEILISPKELSHKCTWNQGLKQNELSIYPKKDEVWAIYNDLHFVKCDSTNPEQIASFGYSFVEILLDICSDYVAIECVFLEKVEGFETVFRRKMEGISSGVFRLRPCEFFLLSHKLPAIRLAGNEGGGIESGMWEVDHLSLPNNLMTLPFDIARDWIKPNQS